ncbi:MAG: glycosyltransferase [Vampirovibrionales bacterium]|nr:glycosyltransferase [Vampirovibrionales bacterium]
MSLTIHALPLASRPQAKKTEKLHFGQVTEAAANVQASAAGLNAAPGIPQTPMTGIWVSAQGYHPEWESKHGVKKIGGLAEVSYSIPQQVRAAGVDLRPLFPLFKGFEKIGFEPTGLPSVTVKGPDGKDEVYNLLWKNQNGVIHYAVSSDSLNVLENIDKAKPIEVTPEQLPESERKARGLNGHGTAPGTSGNTPVVYSSGNTPVVSASSGNTQAVFAKQEKIMVNPEVIKLNQAIAEFLPMLDVAGKAQSSQPWQIKGGNKMVIANDWMNAELLPALAIKHPDYKNQVRSIFYTHNTYDSTQTKLQLKLAEKLGIAIPEDLKNEHTYLHAPEPPANPVLAWFQDTLGLRPAPQKKTNDLAEWVSALRMGVRYADDVVINQRFKESILSGRFGVDDEFKRFLAQKESDGNVFDMQHALSKLETPVANKHLGTEGYTPLEASTHKALLAEPAQKFASKASTCSKPESASVHATRPQPVSIWQQALHWAQTLLAKLGMGKTPDPLFTTVSLPKVQKTRLAVNSPTLSPAMQNLKQFKQTNKLALQKQFGLPQNPNAVLYSTTLRFSDMRQKGSLLLMQTLEKFMTEHEDAQFILNIKAGDKANTPILEGFIQALENNPVIRDRVKCIGWIRETERARILAGADCMMTPSGYEPYGLTQLEPMAYGAVPIVSNRDGLFASVYDPSVLPAYNHHPGEAKKSAYGQTGYMVDSDMLAYMQALDGAGPSGPDPQNPAIRNASKAFLKTLERTYRDAQSGEALKVASNALRYVAAEHKPDAITEKYYVPLFKHVQTALEAPKLAQSA